MKKAIYFTLITLFIFNLCACATPADTTDNNNNTTSTIPPTQAATQTPTPIPEKDNTDFSELDAKLRVLDNMSKEYTALDFDEMDELYYDLDACLITFPSTNEIEKDRFVEATTADELMAYINENNNIWKI